MRILEHLRYLVLRKVKSLAARRLRARAPRILEERWAAHGEASREPIRLDAAVHVNLTSYPARFHVLDRTIKSLLLQEPAPQRTILWLYGPDLAELPDSVRALESRGLTIETVDHDLRSYKKLIPALERYPDAIQVTADDDLYYPEGWLAELVRGHREHPGEILCRRAHLVTFDRAGRMRPYRAWHPKTEVRGPDDRLFFTSGAGVLFPPGSLHPEVTNRERALALAPHADDLWWFWMARLAGSPVRRVGDNPALIPWEDARGEALWRRNKQEDGGNDTQIERLTAAYGEPFGRG